MRDSVTGHVRLPSTGIQWMLVPKEILLVSNIKLELSSILKAIAITCNTPRQDLVKGYQIGILCHNTYHPTHLDLLIPWD